MSRVNKPELLSLAAIGVKKNDQWGFVWPFEFNNLPFTVKRIFIAGNNSKVLSRGNHAHKECHQILICISGQIECEARSIEGDRILVNLTDSSNSALYLPPMTWGIQDYKLPESKLLVLASHSFSEEDYIRNIDTYNSLKDQHGK